MRISRGQTWEHEGLVMMLFVFVHLESVNTFYLNHFSSGLKRSVIFFCSKLTGYMKVNFLFLTLLSR